MLFFEAVQKDQAVARMVLYLMFRLFQYLEKQGIASWEHGHRDGNLWHLMVERTACLSKDLQWLLRRDNWMSDTT